MMNHASNVIQERERHQRIGWILAALMLGTVMSTLDTTIVSSAMPKIISDIHGLRFYSWAFTAYMLTSTVFLPLFGKMSDVYGRKRVYIAALVLFVVGSVWSALAASMPALIASRAIQGIGGGGLAPVAMAIIGDLFTPERRRKVQGMFAGVFALGTISGSVLGGVITQYLSWHWVFWVNVPVGLLDLSLVALALRERPAAGRKPLDVLGAVLLMAALTDLMLTLAVAGVQFPWSSPQVVAMLLAFVVLTALCIAVERKAVDPMLPLPLFRDGMFAGSLVLIFLMGGALFGAVTFIPLFAQGAAGVDAAVGGTIMTPGMLAMAVISVVVGLALGKVGPRPVVLTANIMLAAVFYALSKMTPSTPIWHTVAFALVLGVAFGGLQSGLFSTVQDVIHEHVRGVAMSLAEFSHVIGGTIGITVMNAVMNRGLSTQLERVQQGGFSSSSAKDVLTNPNLLMDAGWKARLPEQVLQVVEQALAVAVDHAFLVSVAIAALAAFGALWLRGSTARPATAAPTVHEIR